MSQPIDIATPFDADDIYFRKMVAREELGRPFHYDLELLSENPTLNPEEALGQSMTIRLLAKNNPRYFNGICTQFGLKGSIGRFFVYKVVLRPWLWFLSRSSDCRIYPNNPESVASITVPDIIKDVFRIHGFSDFADDALTGEYQPREFCVQYNESYLDFIHRLMEEEGIYYYFEHEEERHMLRLVDGPTCHTPITDYETVEFRDDVGDTHRPPDCLFTWGSTKAIQTGAFVMDEFEFAVPNSNMQVRASIERDFPGAGFEQFEYRGGYVGEVKSSESDDIGDAFAMDRGQQFATARLEELQAKFETFRGSGNARGFYAGGLFELIEAPRPDMDRPYLITHAVHKLFLSGYEGVQEESTEQTYECFVSSIDAAVPFRLARRTRIPRIEGPQTAIVTGRSDEEIDVDKHGRIKVKFHWDRYREGNETSSCPVRVVQPWAGPGRGAWFTPRIGDEVIVVFLNGDMNHPVVVGSLYNGIARPPYEFPANQSQTGIKSRSTKGGTDANFNELRFEDKMGSEQVFLHAEKTLKIDVKDSESETVGSSISTNAGGAITRNSGASISRTADQDITDKAGNNMTSEATKDINFKAGGSYGLLTNLGIQIKAMNFVAMMIESGAKAAAAALTRGAASGAAAAVAAGAQGGATEGGGEGLGAAGDSALSSAAQTGAAALAALSPAIEAGAAELNQLSEAAAEGMGNLDGPVEAAIQAADALGTAIESGASPEAIAAAFMGMADAVAEAFEDAQKIIEGLLPQIPSITLWAMKDINALALWSMSFEAKVKDITIKASNRNVGIEAKQGVSVAAKKKDIDIKAKKNIKLEAEDNDIDLKAKKENIKLTGKKKITIKSEDDDLVIEAGKKKVFIKGKKQIFLKCGKASISLAESGNIVINGNIVNVKGKAAVSVKGKPVKLN
ncbi:MAG: type VI secretion system tip protein VgrG [Candidatus Eisenbacteria bacterium]|uniref:Type VI secretion system tip protein VgrG n=1 Tax=Eiseniibacteriota bacterium TaxID=2212470 RepID=A0A7Y2EE41_UNCEI|nr:type VI secretion system tip protein VgrG [Candidatus Eisenbacteria bacterium]